MAYIKKQAYEAVMQKLDNELASLNYKILRNKNEFKKLAQEQGRMKRERGILCGLIRDLREKQKMERS